MKRYRGDVKDNVIRAAGWTIPSYEAMKGESRFPDSVDKVIIGASLRLKRKYQPVFGPLYHCQTEKQVIESIALTHDKVLKEETIRDYMRRSRSDLIKIIVEDDDIMSEIREAIEHDQRKKQ